MSAPLDVIGLLTEHWELDKMHRRAGRESVLSPKRFKHADAHKYCPLGRCGTRPGAYQGGSSREVPTRSAKITAWRIAKAKANRAYLEENVYAKTQ